YIFVLNGATWSQQAYLKASNTGAADFFGQSVAISGDTVVIGAAFEGSNATGVNGDQSNNSAAQSGAAYVFVRSGTAWSQQAYLKASNTGASDNFGYSVAIAGNTVVVGAIGEDSNATGVNGNQSDNSAADSGAVYIFVRSGTTWSQQAYLKASNTGVSNNFGGAVAISSDTVVVGAAAESSNATGVNGDQNNNLASLAGAAYVFVRSGTTWSQQAYLKASNTRANDQFSTSVAISGDTVVVGSPNESSNATGVNGDQTNNLAGSSGAAYVFMRSGGTWSQQAYLKASNTGANDGFGRAVAIAGNTVVVGASFEDSNATGVNGDQTNNSTGNSGAAYVFMRSGGAWSQQAYLKASNTGGDDRFGWSVGIADDTVVVGAFFEDSNATGVNGDQSNNSVGDSGAVYIFTGFLAPPTITPAGPISRVQGTTLSNPANDAVVATVSDTNPGTLTVTQTNASPGVNALGFLNNNGTVIAAVGALCSATVGANFITLTVTNTTTGLSSSANLTVNVISNTSPTVTYNNATVAVGNATTVTPATGPLTNISSGLTLQSVTPSPAPATITVNNLTGVVSVPNNVPPGTYTITVHSVDNCGLAHDAPFTLTVACPSTVVTNGNDNGAGSLRQIIADACPNSTITFQPGVTTVTLTSDELVINKNLTIDGGSGVTVTRSAAVGTPNFRIFDVTIGNTATFNNLTITNGNHSTQAGGVQNSGMLTLNNCVVSGNTSNQAGGLQNDGVMLINSCTIANNLDNNGFFGGGGAITNFGSSLTITGSTIAGNSSLGLGGGISQHTGLLTVSNSTFSGNSAGGFGGALILGDSVTGTASLTNCTFSGNTSIAGGAIYAHKSTTLTNCTLTLNRSDNGGGINTTAQMATLRNTIVAGNTKADGVTVNNLVGTIDASSTSNITSNSGVLLAPLGNYGGPTQTHALLPGSLGINTGTSTNAPATDQRGVARVGNVDIGAFESSGFTLTIAGGNNQSAPGNTNFPQPLSVSVTGTGSEPVNGGRISFTASSVNNASCTIFGNPATIAGGTATTGNVRASGIGGPYTVTADATGVLVPAVFSLTNTNTAPGFTPASAISRRQGSPAGVAVTIGTVSDVQTFVGDLIVTQIAGGTATGISITNITNTGGTIRAIVGADCNAVGGTVRFQVSDGDLTGTGDLTIEVTANTAPTLNYANVSVNAGAATSNSPTAATDNGSITSYAVQSQGSYTGTISVNASGTVSIGNA
ncbi:MAG TPA: FG-GAP repeat protein, partial [Blastocatellia bacterium]|nr:FG-GAP repeat protein [Blastocatellia bacterium]